MGENARKLVQWLSALHAPLGRWTPLAASALFAAAGVFRSPVLRALSYAAAIIFGLLIAADIAGSFIDRHSFPDPSKHHCAVMTLPMLLFRVLLAGILGSFYAFLVFAGIGLWMPFLFMPVIFLACCFVAWRNVSLWYEQGEEFEEALARDDHYQHAQNPQTLGPRAQ